MPRLRRGVSPTAAAAKRSTEPTLSLFVRRGIEIARGACLCNACWSGDNRSGPAAARLVSRSQSGAACKASSAHHGRCVRTRTDARAYAPTACFWRNGFRAEIMVNIAAAVALAHAVLPGMVAGAPAGSSRSPPRPVSSRARRRRSMGRRRLSIWPSTRRCGWRPALPVHASHGMARDGAPDALTHPAVSRDPRQGRASMTFVPETAWCGSSSTDESARPLRADRRSQSLSRAPVLEAWHV